MTRLASKAKSGGLKVNEKKILRINSWDVSSVVSNSAEPKDVESFV